ncbi:hypothetical protein [Planobispora takensis]|uniref:Uncharacterized protein n=1 Tax=Planobispora takensis TaxID=1367882 RepID=A0A8J3WVU3_9ACTN|nr:hypothetical protein [Planobispora takensis]GII03083.1 hypothetical protein Pta02_50910 [Planobispora takensis]
MAAKSATSYDTFRPFNTGGTAFEDPSTLQSRTLLESLNRFLQVTVPQKPRLVGVVPVMREAVRLYRAGQYPASLKLAENAAEVIKHLGEPFPTPNE